MSPTTRTLLLLTFVTGIVDAVSFLGLGQVFVAMQTGNVIFLGFGVAGAAGAAVVGPLIGLAAFLVGGGAAAVITRGRRPRPHRGLALAMAAEVVLLGCAALIAATIEIAVEEISAYALIATLALAMGFRNTMARRLGGANLVTTVVNLTLIGTTGPISSGTAERPEIFERGAALAAIFAGAATGALLLKTSLALPIAAAAAVTLTAFLLHARDARRL